MTLTAEYLRRVLSYSPITGLFVWTEEAEFPPNLRARYIGKVAGCVRADGYTRVSVNKQVYYAHRLAWLWMTGEWPGDLQVDHKDLNPQNNKWANLRIATQAQNNWNTAINAKNTSGAKGVSLFRGMWRASIKLNGRNISLGQFKNKDDAIRVRERAAGRYHGDFARMS